MTHRIITIDGPAGAGKTTISNLVAKQLGCVYVDTGALYRGVAYEIGQQGVNWKDDNCLGSFLASLDLNFHMENGHFVLISSGKDITPHIRTPEISMLASATSARPQVRAALLTIQRNIAQSQDAVFEGRDMGTVVFPDADFKFFLFADLAVRAKRRHEEMSEGKTDIQKVEQDMKTRDANDSQRKEAPLKAAPDAVKIDSSHLTIPDVVKIILKNIQKG
ncbi:MAG: (d)CMP kinase [Proteobacteria bacterium]|nr:(d)CMP kinase [Desulfobacula sp.]MBU4131668.1 (d)CMP kinase [Pseudomonadota bacterium]